MTDAQPLACVVEDEPAIQLALRRALELQRYRVLTFESAEAFEAAKPARPHVLVVDKNLPGLSGLDLVERRSREGDDFEAILITGYADLDSAIKAVRLGFYSYLRKPFNFEQVIRDVAGAAERLQRHAAASPPLSEPAGETGGVQEIPLLQLTREVVQQLSPQARRGKRPLWLEAERNPTVRTDRRGLHQLIRSVLSLALELGKAGQPIVVDIEQARATATLHALVQQTRTAASARAEQVQIYANLAAALGGELRLSPYLDDDGLDLAVVLPLASVESDSDAEYEQISELIELELENNLLKVK